VSQTATDNSSWSYPAATASMVAYTPNALDQYAAIGAVTPTYDANGELTYDGTFIYGYDAEGRLISASGAGNTASYAYDAQGRRKSKTVNGTTTLFVQDPQSRALIDYNGAGGAVLDWYAFGLGPNDVLNQLGATTRATYVPDIQGSIVAALDAASGALTKAGFQPFGESPSTAGTFRYTGARIDAETGGLHDFRARMYSPTLGRFLQTDPIGTAGDVNLYAYTDNDPLNQTDPSGRCPWCVIGAVAGASIEAAMEYHNGALGWTWSSAGRIGLAAATGAIGGGAAGAIGASIVGEGVAAIATRIGLNTIAGAAVSAANTTGSDLIQSGTLPSGGELTSSAIGGGTMAFGGAIVGEALQGAGALAARRDIVNSYDPSENQVLYSELPGGMSVDVPPPPTVESNSLFKLGATAGTAAGIGIGDIPCATCGGSGASGK
jgi:RHS repeat-associated protein